MRTTLPALSKPPIMGGLFNPVPICRRRERLKRGVNPEGLLEQDSGFRMPISGACRGRRLLAERSLGPPECALFNFPARGRRC